MKKKKAIRDLTWDIALFLFFVIYTFVVATFDVRQIDGAASEVGLSTINEFFFRRLPYNDVFYTISKYLGYASFLLVAYFAFIGLMQLIQRKSILKVDRNILIFGGILVLMLTIYVLFEFAIINYRPIIIDPDEGLEASYPSSHTFLAMCICGIGYFMIKDYIKNKNLEKILSVVLILAGVIIVLSRLLSGVHWFTDILGSVILGSFVIKLFLTVSTPIS